MHPKQTLMVISTFVKLTDLPTEQLESDPSSKMGLDIQTPIWDARSGFWQWVQTYWLTQRAADATVYSAESEYQQTLLRQAGIMQDLNLDRAIYRSQRSLLI